MCCVSVAVRSVKSPKLLLRLRRGLSHRLDVASHEVARQQPADSDWHAMLERLDAEARAKERLHAAELALNRLARSEPN
jgi:hypothetical protein